MSIGMCQMVGIEGAHGTGKSTLALAVAAECKRRHIHAACLIERARESPFIEDTVIRNLGPVTIYGELHLLGEQIAAEQRLARHHSLVVCDKTVANVLGYARLLLGKQDDPFTRELLERLPPMLESYARLYDRVFFLSDFYDLERTHDPFRPSDAAFQLATDEALRVACADLKLKVEFVAPGLEYEAKVRWVVERIVEETA
jgi:hypothetical protein